MATTTEKPRVQTVQREVAVAPPTRSWWQTYRKLVIVLAVTVVALILFATVGMPRMMRAGGDSASTARASPAVAGQSEGVAPAAAAVPNTAPVTAPAAPVAPGSASASAAPVAAMPSVPAQEANIPAGVLFFENPLSLIEAKRAGNVKIGSIVQVSGTLHPDYPIKPDVVFAVHPPDVKWYANSLESIRGAVTQCQTAYSVDPDQYTHTVENLRIGDKITVRGKLGNIWNPMPTPIGGATRLVTLNNCTIVSK